MIRIAFFAPWLTTGGTQRHLQQVLRLLDRSRFTPHLFTLKPGGEVEGELEAAGVPVTPLHLGTSFASPRSWGGILRAGRALRTRRVDVVHGYQWRPALVGAIAARLAGVRVVIAGKRSLTGPDRTARRAWRFLGRRVDAIVANADALRAEAEADGVVARWTIIPSAVDTDQFRDLPDAATARPALGLDPARPVVGTIGRLEGRKGQDVLLAAMRHLVASERGERPQLLIVGDGPTRPQLVEQARALGVADDVRFTGTLADVRAPLAAMDVFVLPSRTEGLSNALLEAMAASRPVVATAVGGTVQVIDRPDVGVLVPSEDAAAMAREIARLLWDRGEAARLGRGAQRRVEGVFGAGAMVARLEHLYEERLGRRREKRAA